MKTKRILFLIIVLSLLSNTISIFGVVKSNASNITVNNNTQIVSQDNELTEALTILNENPTSLRTKPLTIEQTEMIIKEIYPEILEYIPIENLYTWVKDNPKKSNLINLSNAIHEENHIYSYTKSLNPTIISIEKDISNSLIWVKYRNKDKVVTFYYIDGEEYTINPSKTFPSSEMIDLIPENARKLFHNNYIINKDSFSNTTGIYGMVNEYNSYSKEFNFYRNFYEFTDNNKYVYTIRILNLYEMITEIENNILAYLIYAEENYPKYFEQYIENINLRQVYSRNKDKTEEYIKDFLIFEDLVTYKIIEDEKFVEMQKNFYIEKITE